MALTRRTRRFRELAQAVEERLAARDLDIGSDVVDQILRNRIDAVAEVMRVTPRTALGYAPENLPDILAETIEQAAQLMEGPDPSRPAPGHGVPSKRGSG